MTDQEKKINDIAEASIQRFRNLLPWGTMTETQYEKLCVKCAIECWREKISTLNRLAETIADSNNDSAWVFVNKVNDVIEIEEKVLDNLNQRI